MLWCPTELHGREVQQAASSHAWSGCAKSLEGIGKGGGAGMGCPLYACLPTPLDRERLGLEVTHKGYKGKQRSWCTQGNGGEGGWVCIDCRKAHASNKTRATWTAQANPFNGDGCATSKMTRPRLTQQRGGSSAALKQSKPGYSQSWPAPAGACNARSPSTVLSPRLRKCTPYNTHWSHCRQQCAASPSKRREAAAGQPAKQSSQSLCTMRVAAHALQAHCPSQACSRCLGLRTAHRPILPAPPPKPPQELRPSGGRCLMLRCFALGKTRNQI